MDREEAYKTAYEEMFELLDLLGGDRDRCAAAARETGDQFWRRAYTRALFAQIEGFTYRMRLQAFHAHEVGDVVFSRAELALLLEEAYDLDNRGHPKTRTSYTSLERALRFAVRMYARAFGADFELDCSDHRWDAFKRAVAIRNRVTHPKSTQDLDIADPEMQVLREADRWYMESMVELLIQIRFALQRQLGEEPSIENLFDNGTGSA